MRLEAALAAALTIRAAGKATLFPLASVLEGPQRSPETAAVELRVERLAWDSLEIHSDGDGFVAPGSPVTLGVGLNVIAPDATEVAVRLSVLIRSLNGDTILSQVDRTEVVAPNCAKPAIRNIATTAPLAEGVYMLELQANWEAVGPESSRLSRWMRKRRTTIPATARRRMSLVVVDPKYTPPLPRSGGQANAPGAMVDEIDWARVRGNRPSASGRAPLPALGLAWPVPESALVEASRRDRIRGWMLRGNAEPLLGAADTTLGLAWTAVGLRVSHPGRPHRLSLSATGGKLTSIGVALIAPGVVGNAPRILLDTCASGPASSSPQGSTVTHSWPVWPDAAEPVLLVFNRGTAPVRLGAVELQELGENPAPAPLSETHPEAARDLAICLTAPGALDRFGGHLEGGMTDTLTNAQNLASYLVHCGASTAVLSSDLADRPGRHTLDGQFSEDFAAPDRLDVVLHTLESMGLSAFVELGFDGTLPGLPPADSREALAKGLVRVDRRGQADGPAYQPLRPEVRAAMVRHAQEVAAVRKAHANLRGLITRLGSGATLPGSPGVGVDDGTYERFVRETFNPEDASSKPGLGTTDPGRFAARQQYLLGSGSSPWLAWRAKAVGELYTELSAAVRQAAPGAIFAVATPAFDAGTAGEEARRADLTGLPATQAWKAVGLDLAAWPTENGPVVLRTVGLSTDDLAHDLSISPELDQPVAARPGSGSYVAGFSDVDRNRPATLKLCALPMTDGPLGDEPFGHAVAALDARWVFVDGTCVAGQEERLRRFARVFRALPAPITAAPQSPRTASGAVVRSRTVGNRSYLSLANDTPYTIVVGTALAAPSSAIVDDLGRGQTLDAKWNGSGKELAVELLPFGVSAIRVGSPDVPAGAFKTYLVGKRDLDSRAEAMSALLERPGAIVLVGPRNGAFEPPLPASKPPIAEIASTLRAPTSPVGWSAQGEANAVELDSDRPHGGSASLRLDAKALPASALSEPFTPPLGEPLTVRCWLRASPPELPVRIWIEGQVGARPVVRRADVVARGDWTVFEIRAADLPAAGLDRARLRFEALAAGRLWADDLTLSGSSPADSDRRARRALTAAVHAYREGRYADFARLAGSSWARRLGVLPVPEPEPATALAPPLPPDSGGAVRR
jgi:hypothetical protein